MLAVNASMDGMNTSVIIGIVVAVVVLAVVVLVVGLNRNKAKKVSFTPKEEKEQKELTQQEKSGNYQAQGGFNFAPAKPEPEKIPVSPPLQTPGGSTLNDVSSAQPHKDDEAAPGTFEQLEEFTPDPTPEDHPQERAVADAEAQAAAQAEKEAKAEAEAAARRLTEKEEVEKKAAEAKAAQEAAEEKARSEAEAQAQAEAQAAQDAAEAEAKAKAEAEARRVAEEKAAAEEAAKEKAAAEAAAKAAEQARLKAEAEAKAAAEEEAKAEAQAKEAAEAAAAAAAVAEAAASARHEVDAPTQPTPTSVGTELDEIDPAAGRLGRLRGRLSRSQNVFGKSVLGMISAGDLDDDAWEDIEDQLVQADLGSGTTATVVDELREMIAERGVTSEAEARAMLRECLIKAAHPEMDRSIKAMPYEGKPAVILVVGVNGTGKTTTTGKLARVLVSMGHSVVLGAADTFRAAAADQLETWGRRVGAVTVRGKEGADPASVAFDAVSEGISRGADVVLIDTAGRLHNSANLMDQLGKVKRVVEKKTVVDEVLLVLDATTGQNGMMQAKEFAKAVQITGVALTKLDGTAKGGIVFSVQNELGVPVKLVGLGEGADHLAPFEVEGFVDALLGGV